MTTSDNLIQPDTAFSKGCNPCGPLAVIILQAFSVSLFDSHILLLTICIYHLVFSIVLFILMPHTCTADIYSECDVEPQRQTYEIAIALPRRDFSQTQPPPLSAVFSRLWGLVGLLEGFSR